MKNEYRHTHTTVSLINYHFVFCPRYRRKIFVDTTTDNRFQELVREICQENDWQVIALETDKDHCHLFVNALPTDSPSSIMKTIKGKSSRILRDEFTVLSRMPSVWTRSFFVSTAGNVSSETIKRYVESPQNEDLPNSSTKTIFRTIFWLFTLVLELAAR